MPVLATTATANDRVVQDVADQLGHGATVLRGPLARHSLQLDAIVLENQAERLAWLAEQLPLMPGSGIVYCLTVADTQRVATFLRSQGIDAHPYNADLSTEEREALEDALVANEMKALVATVALGMGFDKPDLGFVVHYQRPGSAIAYYQQVGRAGRAVDHAYGVVLSGREDDDIAEFFMDKAFPPTANMHEILRALEAVDSMSIGQAREVGQPRSRADHPGAQAARARWRRRARWRALRADGRAVGPGRGADRAGHRGSPGRARADAGVHAPRRLPDGVPDPTPGRSGPGTVRSVRELYGEGAATDR